MVRKPGLWHGPRRVEVEAVKTAHKLGCSGCQQRPESRRLAVRSGYGRRQTMEVYCIGCGKAWLNERRVEAERAVVFLETGNGAIRL
jgi:hypothetical protein